MSVVEKTAGQLVKGDVLLNTGATVNLAVVHAHGDKVYLDMTFEDGWVKCETVAADTLVAVWIA